MKPKDNILVLGMMMRHVKEVAFEVNQKAGFKEQKMG